MSYAVSSLSGKMFHALTGSINSITHAGNLKICHLQGREPCVPGMRRCRQETSGKLQEGW